jgi:ABC-2 type transport system permease protein
MLAKLHLGINPIIVKELRSRMRDTRAFITLTAMLVILGSSSYLLYRLALTTSTYHQCSAQPTNGQSLFIALAFLELMIICAIVPAVTAVRLAANKRSKPTTCLWLLPYIQPASCGVNWFLHLVTCSC